MFLTQPNQPKETCGRHTLLDGTFGAIFVLLLNTEEKVELWNIYIKIYIIRVVMFLDYMVK